MAKKQTKSNSAGAQAFKAPDAPAGPAQEPAKDTVAPPPAARPAPRLTLLFWLLAGLVLGLAAYFRLNELGRPSLRADTIVFWNLCQSKLGFADIYRLWMTDLGMKGSGQFPFALAFTKGFLDLLGLPLTQFTLRLPAAIWGILTVAAAFGCGRSLSGRWFGLVFAALLAVSPFHVGTTREAYYYPPMVFGNVLLLWAVVRFVSDWLQRRQPGRAFYPLFAFGLVLSTYVQASSWPFAALSCGLIVGLLLWGLKSGRAFLPGGGLCLAIMAVVGLPLLLVDWGLAHMIFISTGEHKAYSAKVFGSSSAPVWQMFANVGVMYAWGKTPLRAALTVGFGLLGVLGVARLWNRERAVRVLPYYLAGVFILFFVAQVVVALASASRYLLPLLPVYLAFLALGFVVAPQWLEGRGLPRLLAPLLAAGLAVLAVGMNLRPAWLYSRLDGKPTPYAAIQHWADTQLSPGTLVLVDRWFEPWNELQVYASTNAVFTFTVPNEPPENLVNNRWRDSVTNFFRRFPDAAYLELNQSYAHVPGQGPWPWLTNWFPRRVVFTNAAGLALRELGLANREDYFEPATNRLLVTAYFCTRADAVDRARAAGDSFAVFYGPEWGYHKPWRQPNGSFADLRVLGQRAGVDIYNLADTVQTQALVAVGVAANGAKHVGAAGARIECPQGRRVRLETPPLALAPGSNRVEFVDLAGPASRSVLFIESLAVGSPSVPVSEADHR